MTAEQFNAIASEFDLSTSDFEFYDDDKMIEAIVFKKSPSIISSLKEMSAKCSRNGGVAMVTLFSPCGKMAGIAQYFSGWPDETDNGWTFISLTHPNCQVIMTLMMPQIMAAFATSEVKLAIISDLPGSN